MTFYDHVAISEFEDKIVFTTDDRSVAAKLMMICEDANITESETEYHYQGWITKR